VARPVKELKAYKRVTLKPGQTRRITLPLAAKSLAYWKADEHRWVIEPDSVRLLIGASSADIRVSKTIAAGRK
jgi:beta-glucosidase